MGNASTAWMLAAKKHINVTHDGTKYCIAGNFQVVKFSKTSVNIIFENPPNNA